LEGMTINSGDGPRTKEERDNLDNVQVSVNGGGGNSATYLTRRIARDFPEILNRMKSGEFKSVRAAAKEAGIVKDPTPLQLLHRAWKKATLNGNLRRTVARGGTPSR